MSTLMTASGRVRSDAGMKRELLSRMARVMARTCTADTLVVAADPEPFLDALRGRHWKGTIDEAADGLGCGLIVASEPTEIEGLPRTLERVWSRLPERGRLLVAVPNEDAHDGKDRQAFGEGDLRRLLESYGRPLLLTEQPFEWLLMYVEKKKSGYGGVPRSRTERFEAMAELCRGSVVELGCGAGELAAEIRRRGHSVVGVDLNRPKIERARREFPGIEFIDADICLPGLLEGRQFDTVMLAEVLEHVPEAVGNEMLAVARRLLHPGGRVIVSVPNRNCIPHRNHIRVFDRKTLKALLLPFGEPQTIASQPYKWLLMYADLR